VALATTLLGWATATASSTPAGVGILDAPELLKHRYLLLDWSAVRDQHGQRLHEHRRRGGVQRRRLLHSCSASLSVVWGGCPGPPAGHGPPRPPRDPRDRRPRARASAGPGRWWTGRTAPLRRTRLDRGRPARLPYRPRPMPRPARRSAQATCPIHRGELGLAEGYRRFDRLMAGWLRASPMSWATRRGPLRSVRGRTDVLAPDLPDLAGDDRTEHVRDVVALVAEGKQPPRRLPGLRRLVIPELIGDDLMHRQVQARPYRLPADADLVHVPIDGLRQLWCSARMRSRRSSSSAGGSAPGRCRPTAPGRMGQPIPAGRPRPSCPASRRLSWRNHEAGCCCR
jgi:hypothetical protein